VSASVYGQKFTGPILLAVLLERLILLKSGKLNSEDSNTVDLCNGPVYSIFLILYKIIVFYVIQKLIFNFFFNEKAACNSFDLCNYLFISNRTTCISSLKHCIITSLTEYWNIHYLLRKIRKQLWITYV